MKWTGEVLSRGRVLPYHIHEKKAQKTEFEQICLSQLSHLYTFAISLTRDRGMAEDLVQEAYLRAFRLFHKFEPGSNCRAWLLSILRNLFINRYQQKRRELKMVDWERVDQVDMSMADQCEKTGNIISEHPFLSKLMDEEVDKALMGLPEENRTAIILVDIEDLSYEEAAKVVGCPVGTVRSRASKGRRILLVELRTYALEKGLISG